MATLNKGGKPRTFSSLEHLNQSIENYIKEATELDDPLALVGLAAFMNSTKDTIRAYSVGEYDEFDDDGEAKVSYSLSLKRLKTRIEAQQTTRLLKGKGSTIGTIFNLKNNFGWADKTELHSTTESHTTIVNKTMTDEQAQEAYNKQMG